MLFDKENSKNFFISFCLSKKNRIKEKRPPIVMLLICCLHKNEKTLTHPEGFRDSNRMFFLHFYFRTNLQKQRYGAIHF